MKKTLSILTVLSIALSFTGCKKGEDDPSISFRSRKARVVGEWKVTSIKHKTVSTNMNTVVNEYTMTNGTYKNVVTTPDSTTETTGTHTWEWMFKADADARYESVSIKDGVTTTSGGKWNFSGGLGKLKNKSQILLYELSNYTYQAGGYSQDTYNEISTAYHLKELRNKKMVWTYKNKLNQNGTTETDIEIVFESK